MDKALVSIPAACAELGGVCRGTIYNLIRDGKLSTVKVGRRRMIRTESLRLLISE